MVFEMFPKKLQFASKLNPIWKGVAKQLVEECKRCNQPRLYSVFEAYISGSKPNCKACSTTSRLTHPIIKRLFSKANLAEAEVKKLMADTLIRKSMLNVVRGISHFGLRTPQPTAVPVVIVWNFTNRCNLYCRHCHQNSGEADERELTTEEVLQVIKKLEDAGISILTFSGGELSFVQTSAMP